MCTGNYTHFDGGLEQAEVWKDISYKDVLV